MKNSRNKVTVQMCAHKGLKDQNMTPWVVPVQGHAFMTLEDVMLEKQNLIN